MVVFACNNCGESLKKAQVEFHVHGGRCRGCSVSCMDCHRDFDPKSYKHHIKCITEDEKYSGGNYKPKESTLNGERKRNTWLELVQKVASEKDSRRLSGQQELLDFIANLPSVPTKINAFTNFVNNSKHNLVRHADAVWAMLQKAKEAAAAAPNSKQTVQNEKPEESKEVDNSSKSAKKKKSLGNGTGEEQVAVVDSTCEESTKADKKKNKKTLTIGVDEKEMTEETVRSSKSNNKRARKMKKRKISLAEAAKKKSLTNGPVEEELMTPKDKFNEGTTEAPKSEKKKKRKSEVVEEVEIDDGTVETEAPKSDKKKKRKSEVVKEVEVNDGTVETGAPKSEKKKKRKSEVLEEVEVNDGTVETGAPKSEKKKKRKSEPESVEEVQVDESTVEPEVPKSEKKKKRKSKQVTDELSTPKEEISEDGVEEAEANIPFIDISSDVESKKNKSTEINVPMEVDEVTEVTKTKPLSRKQQKKLEKKEIFDRQLALIEKDKTEAMKVEDDVADTEISKKDKKKKKKNTVNQHQVIENGDDKSEIDTKKAKKRKQESECEADIDSGKKSRLNDTLEEPVTPVTTGEKFKWKTAIEDVLNVAKSNRLPVKKVRRKVLNAYTAQGGDPRDKGKSREQLEAKFNKMLGKMSNVEVVNEQARLLPTPQEN